MNGAETLVLLPHCMMGLSFAKNLSLLPFKTESVQAVARASLLSLSPRD